ncbi:MAG: hypothetical protein RQ847_02665 [Wenzhouxiangellaceae bacterium]|nr:hypothetical protein [Wenzhouxiangellaceae bacterium]
MFRRLINLAAAVGALAALALGPAGSFGQEAEEPADAETVFSGLKVRDLGPAVTSGRISDFEMHPDGWHVFYAAVASGGIWKTENGGITWQPVFDDQGSYAVGVVELDPANPDTVWAGTGEDNAQRSVGFGDGVYRSLDGGRSWTNMGLKDSGHIGSIKIDPRDSNVIFVAAHGPLWSAGGDRGVYKTTDGGRNWERVLEIDEHTGVNEVLMHPENPDLLLAASWQRRRHVWTLIDGGPGSGVHRSADGGETWTEITAGLPDEVMGRIGIALAPSRPDVVYAIIEAEGEGAGFYRSTDFGVSWEKRSDYVSGSPQYYNELVVDPVDPDRVYSMDTFLQVSEDGGKNWNRVGIEHKHVDEHALWIDPANTDHLVTGNDGGIYESWDRGDNWRHVRNLPITQFYRATPDNAEPFYNVYGGTQDNSSLGAPSRTTNNYGIANHDWVITLGGDGFETQIDPTNPDTVYSQLQYGMLARFDRRSHERVLVTPMPGADENNYKWNWNSAFILSPHDPKRLYFAAEKIFRSDDGGNSWRDFSPDLTRQLDRNRLEVMGRVWSVDAVAKNDSTSMYGSIISLAESPLEEGLIYAGTDDGLIQVTGNDGADWRRHDTFGDVPEMTYVSDVEASLHDVDTVFATFDNHKRGDYKPYVMKSTDRGRRWRSIAGDLPERGPVHTIVQDHVDPDLLFIGTEFGVWFTQDGGEHWHELTGNMPTIAVRDLEIQRRENDLVIATFGRGIRILDDYRALRTGAAELAGREATLFPIRDPWLYVEDDVWVYGPKGAQGVTYFTADNPPFGAVFTYYLSEGYKSLRDQRLEKESERREADHDNPYPTWDRLREEAREDAPAVIFEITDADGRVVRRIEGATAKGLHRVAWDLRRPAPDPVDLSEPGFRPPWESAPSGPLVGAGTYRVQMLKRVHAETSALTEPKEFTVRELERGQFRPDSLQAHAEAMREAADLSRAVQGAGEALDELEKRVEHLKVALRDTPDSSPEQRRRLDVIEGNLDGLAVLLNGDSVKAEANEPRPMALSERVGMFSWAHWNALAAITDNQQRSLAIARRQFGEVQAGLEDADKSLTALESELAGEAPWTPGRIPRLEN